MTAPLPILPPQTDEHAARLVAGVVALSLAAATLAHAAWVVPLLAAGFVLRALWGARFSPLARLAGWLAARLGPPRPVASTPKRFAQAMGAVCLLGATILLALGWTSAGWTLAALVATFATLESVCAFCMGCWLFAHLPRRRGAEPLCVDCVAPHRSADTAR